MAQENDLNMKPMDGELNFADTIKKGPKKNTKKNKKKKPMSFKGVGNIPGLIRSDLKKFYLH